MRNTLVVTVCILVGCVTLVGCAPVTPNALRAAKGTGLVRVYAAPPTAVWNVVPTVLSDLKLQYIGEDAQAGYLLAESELAIARTGELILVFIEPYEHTRNTRVEVIAERNWASDILNQLDTNLKRSPGH